MRHILTLPITPRNVPAFRTEARRPSPFTREPILTYFGGHLPSPLERNGQRPCLSDGESTL